MIQLNQRHVLTLIDLLKEEESKLLSSNTKKINITQAGGLVSRTWEDETPVEEDRKTYLRKLREMLESEINKATFSFGLDERVNTIHE